MLPDHQDNIMGKFAYLCEFNLHWCSYEQTQLVFQCSRGYGVQLEKPKYNITAMPTVGPVQCCLIHDGIMVKFPLTKESYLVSQEYSEG